MNTSELQQEVDKLIEHYQAKRYGTKKRWMTIGLAVGFILGLLVCKLFS